MSLVEKFSTSFMALMYDDEWPDISAKEKKKMVKATVDLFELNMKMWCAAIIKVAIQEMIEAGELKGCTFQERESK